MTKQERIEGNKLYTRLVGNGFAAQPAYKGGLFEAKSVFQNVWNGYRPEHVSKVIDALSEEEVNNLHAFGLLLKDGIKNDHVFDVRLWLCHPDMKPETIQKAFEEMCYSFANIKQAEKAKEFYSAF